MKFSSLLKKKNVIAAVGDAASGVGIDKAVNLKVMSLRCNLIRKISKASHLKAIAINLKLIS